MTFPNPSKLNLSLKMTILSLLMASLLAGCGIRGQLKTPPPLFGGEKTVDAERVPTEDLDAENKENDELDEAFEDLVETGTLSDF